MEMIQLWNIIPQSIAFPLHLVLILVFLILISHLIYRWVETPTRKFLYRRFDTSRDSVHH